MRHPVNAVLSASVQGVKIILANRRLLASITRVELQKKYAGSVLGLGWVFLQPALLLCVYLFIYLIVFDVRFPGFSTFDYVLYVFCGLVPYLGFMEALTTGGLSIRQNIHLVKNVLLPIVIVLQLLMLIGLTWILAAVTVALPDVTYFVNLFVFLLMFLSPIGFRVEMVPPNFTWVVHLNPVYYMIEIYRDSMLNGTWPKPLDAAVFTTGSLLAFGVGATFFRAFKGVLVDFE